MSETYIYTYKNMSIESMFFPWHGWIVVYIYAAVVFGDCRCHVVKPKSRDSPVIRIGADFNTTLERHPIYIFTVYGQTTSFIEGIDLLGYYIPAHCLFLDLAQEVQYIYIYIYITLVSSVLFLRRHLYQNSIVSAPNTANTFL